MQEFWNLYKKNWEAISTLGLGPFESPRQRRWWQTLGARLGSHAFVGFLQGDKYFKAFI